MITFNNESVNADTYEWDFGNGKTSTLQSPEEVTYIENKTYNVKLIVKRCGNEKTDMFSASVKIDCPTVVAPTITKNITNPCEGQEVILSSSCPSGNTLFWNDGTSATTSPGMWRPDSLLWSRATVRLRPACLARSCAMGVLSERMAGCSRCRRPRWP